MSQEKPESEKKVPPTKKLPYVPPKLVELGTFADMTRAVSNAGSRDGGGGRKDKTSL